MMTKLKYFVAFAIFGAVSLFGDTVSFTPVPGGETDTLSITLDPPDGAIDGPAGATLGWGFAVDWVATNNYISFTGSSLGSVAPGGYESNNSLLSGYTDFIGAQSAPDGIAMGNGTWTQTFDSGAQTGVGAYQVSSAAPASAQDTGQLTFNFDIYSGDPAVDAGAVDLGSFSYYDASTAFSVTVDAPTSGTPEPGTLWLLLGAAVVAGIRRQTAS